MANTDERIKEAETALEFCKSAIEDAIYLEDGLDGGAGEAVVKQILDYYEKYRRDLYKDHQEELKKRSKQPEI